MFDTYLQALTVYAAACRPSPNPKTDADASSTANTDYRLNGTSTTTHQG